jgi:hypothetical protein
MQHLNIKRKESKQGEIISTRLAQDLDRDQNRREIESKLKMQNLERQGIGKRENRHQVKVEAKKMQETKTIQLNWITIANLQPDARGELN